ncbi:hypothetical protein NFI96_025801 [Prochilodus magdalenae]|nr:hypothetical protein NFI96_025801 [Prochilodus magdalenae]
MSLQEEHSESQSSDMKPDSAMTSDKLQKKIKERLMYIFNLSSKLRAPYPTNESQPYFTMGNMCFIPTGTKSKHQLIFFMSVFLYQELERTISWFIRDELNTYKKHLTNRNSKYDGDVKDDKWNLRQAVLNMTQYFLKKMEHEDLADALQNELIGIQQCTLKFELSKKYHHVCEGIAQQGESTVLNKIYTELYITEGGAGQVNKDHEVRLIEKNNVTRDKSQTEQEVQIECRTMFKPLPGQDKPIRTVLTQGVAGIGKSICVQKFILDWAEGKDYQDIQFIFPLPFRELNLKKGSQSLMEIINFFFPEIQGLTLSDRYKLMFILDGLDECKLPLKFQTNETLNDVSKEATLDVVMTNLIKGNLLPSARIWITTRPAAAARIPDEYVHRMTELRGFTDEQKEQYFRKRISDPGLAEKIINHIKESRSLHIMCHIPVFCWISATVLQRILLEAKSEDTPKTLTDMYTSFLIFQTIQGNLKYTGHNASDVPWDTEGILSMGNLAFHHLEESSLVFYTEDLEACGIDPSKISVYSGLCTQERVRFLGTVFTFVHLSVQEFLAALFAYISFRNENKNVLDKRSTSPDSNETDITKFLKTAVDKALDCGHGQMDLFLRFLLGLSLESNENLIRGLLTQKGRRSDSQKDIVDYIKLKFKENPSPERSINLFYCLNELNDDSLVKEIQRYMSSGCLSEAELSPAQWSALVFVLLTSKEKIDVFDLKKFIRSDECLIRLLPVVKEATSALLNDCNLTERSCSALIKVLSSESCNLSKLDLSSNNLLDRGVEKLSAGLKSPHCKLEELRLSFCGITEKGYAALASALKSNPSSHLMELDLKGNNPGDTGMKLLTSLLEDPNCKLKALRLLFCSITKEGYDDLALALKSNPSSNLMELDLRGNDPGDTGVKMIIDQLGDPNCKLKKLRLLNSPAAEEVCDSLTEVLGTNPLLLSELDLSEKIQGDSGIKKISDLLKDLHCRTKSLKLNKSSITEEGCAALLSALCLNPSHLIELDLSENKLGNSGVKKICSLLNNKSCKLQKLGLNNNSITEEGCAALSSALCLNPAHLIELDLSENNLGNSGVKKICSLLNNKSCKLQRLGLSFCSITEKGYATLASVLKSNTSSHLIELDLRGNDPGDSGVKKLTNIFVGPRKTLRLLNSDDAVEACKHLQNILCINPLLQRKLDLRGKIHGDSEMKRIRHLLEDSHCRTQKLMLSNSSITEEGCADLSSALCSNPAHLIELDLSENKLGNSGVKQICSVLKNKSSKLQRLSLSFCSITEEGYDALASVLKSNTSSHLIELDLRGNDPGDSGVKKLTDIFVGPRKTLRLLKSDDAVEACKHLQNILCINPLLQRKLDLRGKIHGDSEMKRIRHLLEDSHCRTQKLMYCLFSTSLSVYRLSNSSITEEGCAALSSALCSNPSHLIELDLSENKLGNSGVKQICSVLKNKSSKLQRLSLSFCSVTEEGYDALASVLKSNPSSHLIELDLRGNDPGYSGVKKLTDVFVGPIKTLRLLRSDDAVIACKHLQNIQSINPLLQRELDLSKAEPKGLKVKQLSALLEDPHCRLEKLTLYKSGSITERDCADLISALTVNLSHLKELDLNENELDQSVIQKLCTLLQNPHCKLEKAILSNCSIKGEGYTALASALKSNPSSHLRELDLRGNDPGDKGVEMLTDLLKDSHCKLTMLRLLEGAAADICESLTKALGVNPLLLRELDLTGKIQGDSELQKLSDLVKDLHCRIQKLKLKNSSITEKGCVSLLSALSSNTSHLIELDLSENKLGKSGVKHISDLLKKSDCKLEKLRLSFCSVTEEGYIDLATALKSNKSSLLKELDLKGNYPGHTGVKRLVDLLEDSKYKLERLSLLNSPAAEELCDSLNKVLGTNPLLLKELDLSGKKQGDLQMKKICDLLVDSHCRTQKLKLTKCGVTEADCAALSSALCSNPSHLTELDLSDNKLGNSGVKQICSLLKAQSCKLQSLGLSFCSITEGGFGALTSALKSNSSSHLIKLDLRGNNPGDTEMGELVKLYGTSRKKLSRLLFLLIIQILMELDCSSLYRLLNSEDAEEAYSCLHKLLQEDPLLLKGLDLSKNKPTDIQVKQLCALLKDPHFRLEKLTLYESGSITERDCADLLSALIVNPSHLRELDLNQNKLDQSGVQKLCTLLQNPHCKVQKLLLNNCSIGEEGCADLTSALTSNPSHLRELDLHGNKLGDSVNVLSDLLQKSGCKLLLDRSFMITIKGVWSWWRGDPEKSETEGGALTAKTEEEGPLMLPVSSSDDVTCPLMLPVRSSDDVT